MPICSLCGKDTDSVEHLTEQILIDLIKMDHPEWVDDDGVCTPCIEYYNNLENAVEIEE
ncbi:MAG: hypothetical protein V3U54_06475 [Thermodesulfobacteriota bacterium]